MSIAKESIDQIWTNAYTEHGFQDKEVDLALIEKALELALLGPSSYNCSPLRVVIVHTPEGKKKLIEAIKPGAPMNVQQTTEAPGMFSSQHIESIPCGTNSTIVPK